MAFIKSKLGLSKVEGNNKILMWLLAVVLAGVWGEVGYRLIWGGNPTGGDLEQGGAELSTQTNKSETGYNFVTNVRDPFSYRPEAQVTKKVGKSALQIWVPPPLKLEGVILKHGKRIAIIESVDGKTFFESPGDTLYSVKILSIGNEKVTYRYEKKDTSWTVGR
jgi:hypothetical protein